MKAVIVEKPGDAGQLKIGEIPTPLPDKNEILVKVHAAALNRADIMQREGRYPPPKGASEILGLEMAGEVAQSLESNASLLIEAGTGTGKSFAYLIPAIYWAVANNTRVIISTNTKNLQELKE